MKKTLSTVLYVALVLLCGVEVGPKLIATLSTDQSSVSYAANVAQEIKAAKGIDYKKMAQASDAHGELGK